MNKPPHPTKTKREANYRESTGDERCGNCSYFLPARRGCSKVQGRIEADDLCDYWESRNSTKA